MRNIQVLVVLVLSSSAAVAANSSTATAFGLSKLSVGIQGGLGFANANTPADISASTRTGFIGGINVQLGINSLLSLQPELMYSQRGANLINAAGVRLTAKTDSLLVPVLLRINFGDTVRPYVFAGPVAVFNLSNRLVAEAGSSTGGVSYNPRSFDFAADVGAGIEFSMFFLNMRYSMGLLGGDPANGTWQSRGFQLLAGVNLGV